MLIIKAHPFRNIGNILNPRLYEKCYIGTKTLIEEFLVEYDLCFKMVQESNLPLINRIQFFREIRHVFGKTALILSGGGLLGMYHMGVVKTLYELKLLPDIISGCSSGSIVAAIYFT